MKYKVLKTTEGKRYKVPMSEQETREQVLYWMAITLLPFIGSALMFFVWVKVG